MTEIIACDFSMRHPGFEVLQYKQDDHLGYAIVRLMFAYDVEDKKTVKNYG